jgi:uncharacterized protein (TIGR03083 family)
MSETPSFPELLSLIDERSAALREALASAPDLRGRVPGCPDWTLTDLVTHLGTVQRFWALVVKAGAADGPPSASSRRGMEPEGDLEPWSAESTRLLLAALGEAGPDAPCWTWWPAPQTAGAVARHQVQEAAVHAYDAQETIGKREPIPASAAVDGVAEFLQVMFGSDDPWPHRPARVAFAATEGPSWVLDVTPTGVQLQPAASGEPMATVHGSASDLVLALYGRVSLDNLRVDGDREAVEDVLTWGSAAE